MLLSRTKRQALCSVLVFSVVASICCGFVQAQSGISDSEYTEYEIKAAFICNFTKFVEWPHEVFASDSTKLVIGILGMDPFDDTMERVIRGRQPKRMGIEVKRFRSAAEIDQCHVLFISRSEENRLTSIIRRIGKTPILTICEAEDFLPAGGIIRLFSRQNKVRFEINPAAAAQVGLMISSKLLKLAENLKLTSAHGRQRL